jgi:hypothetical protein
LAQAIAIGRPWSAPKTDASTPSSCLHGRQLQLKHPERVGYACCLQVEHTPGSMAGRCSLTMRGIASSPTPQAIDRYADKMTAAQPCGLCKARLSTKPQKVSNLQTCERLFSIPFHLETTRHIRLQHTYVIQPQRRVQHSKITRDQRLPPYRKTLCHSKGWAHEQGELGVTGLHNLLCLRPGILEGPDGLGPASCGNAGLDSCVKSSRRFTVCPQCKNHSKFAKV